ncbi:MAG: PorV/PorQ family protein [Lewinellaceae bacterium]|nr:PorV/PorQ family protein [Lewinellaceae bacterium]
MKIIYRILLSCLGLLVAGAAWSGNPDRQGEAGANQLLINPWARSAGLHSLNTSSVTGTDALFMNVAGICRINKTQINLAHTRYLDGADLSLNALGLAQKVGKNGVFGLGLVAFDMGDLEYTTENTPEGTGAYFSPTFFNLAVSYSHLFANKVSVGFAVKMVSESISNASATAVGLDAGVQYVTGADDNFKFGISLRNVGGKMQFKGEGLSKTRPNPGPTFEYLITYQERPAAYELPSQLNIGTSYDWLLGKSSKLSLMGNFCSNAFSRDQYGLGLEFGLNKNFQLRVAYKNEFDTNTIESSLDNGIAAGVTVQAPLKRGSQTPQLAIDYSYRQTKVFNGIHNVGIRIDL